MDTVARAKANAIKRKEQSAKKKLDKNAEEEAAKAREEELGPSFCRLEPEDAEQYESMLPPHRWGF